jgi:hypothetical protein
MSQRTVKLYGKAWGNPANPAEILVKFNDVTVYQGTVLTVDSELSTDVPFSDMYVLAEWQIALDVVGPNSFEFVVTGGDAIFHTLHGNYADRVQLESGEVLDGPDSWGDLSGHSTIESDGHDNVKIDGIDMDRTATENELGKWTWPVYDGQTLTCDVQTVPAQVPDSN